jgi:LEA14-like dessication related protein
MKACATVGYHDHTVRTTLPRYALAALAAVLAAALAAVLAAVLLGGCAPKLERPTLAVVGVQLVSGDLLQQRLKVRLRVHNPNDRALPVKSIEYTLEVAGEPFASGESAEPFTVPALGETEFDMNVTTNLAGTLLKLLARGSGPQGQDVPYRLAGKLSLSAGLLRSIPFEQQGTFSLQ